MLIANRFPLSYWLLLTAISFSILASAQNPKQKETPLPHIETIHFFSGMNPHKDSTILKIADSLRPNLSIFMGNMMMGEGSLSQKYKQLGENLYFQRVLHHSPFLAIWDDTEYGQDDGGGDWRKKGNAQKKFLKFYKIPKESLRYKKSGIYESYNFQTVGNKKVQIILLDTRWGRSNIPPANPENGHDKNLYATTSSLDDRMLNSSQWKWLKEQLREKADIRMIVSSIPFVKIYNGYETWSNFPLEQAKMLDIITKTQAEGVFFISGSDTHYAELNGLSEESMYNIYDLTAGSVNVLCAKPDTKGYRIGKPYTQPHFGRIQFIEDKKKKKTRIELSIIDAQARPQILFNIELAQLTFQYAKAQREAAERIKKEIERKEKSAKTK